VSNCGQFEDMLDELALGVLPGDERDGALAHVEACPRCQAIVDELSRTADDLLAAIPRAEPPLDFCAAVMARVRPARERRPAQRRWANLAAAAVAAVLLVAGGAAVALRLQDQDELRTVALVAVHGGRVGDALTYASPRWYFLRVDHGLADGAYQCVLDDEDGRAVPAGTLVVSAGQGAWGQRLPSGPRQIRAARLVDATGATVASASLS